MFVVLADSRTGTHLLKTLLNSHPQLTCYDEILGPRKDEKDFYRLDEFEGCLVAYPNLLRDNIHAIGNDVDRLIQVIRQCPVIHLTRNLEQRARSWLYYAIAKEESRLPFKKANLETAGQHLPEFEPEDATQICEVMGHLKGRQDECLQLFEGDRDNWLEITYEWLTENNDVRELPEEKSHVLCDYLKVPVTQLQAGTYKIRISGS